MKEKLFEETIAGFHIQKFIVLQKDEKVVTKKIRFRTLGDITITGGIESEADTLEEIVVEVSLMKETERGNRADDKTF